MSASQPETGVGAPRPLTAPQEARTGDSAGTPASTLPEAAPSHGLDAPQDRPDSATGDRDGRGRERAADGRVGPLALECVCGAPVQRADDGDGWTHAPGTDTRCMYAPGARPRCPDCQMPHDLTPGSMPMRACAWIRGRIEAGEFPPADGTPAPDAAADAAFTELVQLGQEIGGDPGHNPLDREHAAQCSQCTPAPDAEDDTQVSVTDFPGDPDQALITLPFEYLDTQVWTVELGVDREVLPQLRQALDVYAPPADETPTPDNPPDNPAALALARHIVDQSTHTVEEALSRIYAYAKSRVTGPDADNYASASWIMTLIDGGENPTPAEPDTAAHGDCVVQATGSGCIATMLHCTLHAAPDTPREQRSELINGPDGTDVTEAEFDRMMADGTPAQLAAPPMDRAAAETFYEDDEDPAQIRAAFERGAGGTTDAPAPVRCPVSNSGTCLNVEDDSPECVGACPFAAAPDVADGGEDPAPAAAPEHSGLRNAVYNILNAEGEFSGCPGVTTDRIVVAIHEHLGQTADQAGLRQQYAAALEGELERARQYGSYQEAALGEVRGALVAAGIGRAGAADWPDVMPGLRELIGRTEQAEAESARLRTDNAELANQLSGANDENEQAEAALERVRTAADTDPPLEKLMGDEPTDYARGWAAAMAAVETALNTQPATTTPEETPDA